MVVEDTPENRIKCICTECSSYPKGCDGELLFCATGASNCEIRPVECICNFCPVYEYTGYSGLYYCSKETFRDAEVSLRKKRAEEDLASYQVIMDIKQMAATGESIVRSMGSVKKIPFSLDDIHFVPAQVHRIPLNMEEDVNTHISIGPNSKKPLKASSPVIISGMSFGAVQKKVRLVISRVASELEIAFNSGEGGILNEELDIAGGYIIGQYSTMKLSVEEEVIKKVAAVEIKFGQGAYPGKGSYLPADKINPEVAKVRGLGEGEASHAPAHHDDMTNPREIEEKVSWLRELSGGVPVGAKIGCGNIEKDVEVLVNAGVDFISLDGFGGGTGATNSFVRDNVGIPIIAALPRASGFLEELGVRDDVSLIAGGGLRTSADFAKCLALGADAVYTGTAALIAINCEQYRVCQTGNCPTGITTHKPSLTRQLVVDDGARRLANFIKATTREIALLARVVGKGDVNELDSDDLVSLDRELSSLTGTRWLNGKRLI